MNRNVDILKYLLSIMIILLHCGFSEEFPILRVAVPLFFVISSYFFFAKISCLPPGESRPAYRKFLVRALKLYAFWTVALLPYMVAVKFQTHLLGRYLAEFPLNLVLRSVFPASWYLAAYIICISLVYRFRRQIWLLFGVGLLLYGFCCLETNYGGLLDNVLPAAGGGYFGDYVRSLYLSFPAGLAFVVAGALIARYRIPMSLALGAALAGGAGLAVEANFVAAAGLRVADDCYFSLLILAPGAFAAVLGMPRIIKAETLWARRTATIYYCSHMVLIRISSKLFPAAGPVEIFVLTLVGATLLAFVLERLSRRLPLLRFSY